MTLEASRVIGALLLIVGVAAAATWAFAAICRRLRSHFGAARARPVLLVGFWLGWLPCACFALLAFGFTVERFARVRSEPTLLVVAVAMTVVAWRLASVRLRRGT